MKNKRLKDFLKAALLSIILFPTSIAWILILWASQQ